MTRSIFSSFRALVTAMRPNQWTKNGLVAASFFFALGDKTQHLTWRAFPAVLGSVAVFCMLSSAVYLVNDVRDREQDRLHPTKRHRPIASGQLAIGVALWAALALAGTGMLAAWFLRPALAGVGLAYLLLQGAYSFGLKRVALVDIFVIALGFVLRALAGAVTLGVYISPWLLLCAMLLALFLALCKRRHEKVILADLSEATRSSLESYHEKLLDQLIGMIGAAVIVCYAIYTLWPDTVHKYGTTRLVWTVPLVIFGLFRYLDLVYRHEKGDRPEKILLTDLPILLNLFLYGLLVLAIIRGPL